MSTWMLLILLLPVYLTAPTYNAGKEKKVDINTQDVVADDDIQREERMFNLQFGDINFGVSMFNGYHGIFDSPGHSGLASDGHTHPNHVHDAGYCIGGICRPVSLRPVDNTFKWEDKIVRYFFTSASNNDQELFRRVMDMIEEKTCFRFQEVNAKCETKGCLEIEIDSASCSDGCYGFVGRVKTNSVDRLVFRSLTQVSDLEKCEKPCQGFILHELIHILGVEHPVTRPDRDDFITVNEPNIKHLKIESLFRICEDCEWYDIPYDCDSIMHYGTIAHGLELMKPKDRDTCNLEPDAKLVRGPNASDLDWKLLNYICTTEESKSAGIIQYLRRLGITIQLMSSKLVKFEKNAPEETSDQASLILTMKEATEYLKDSCVIPNSNCKSDKILEFNNDLQSTFKEIDKISLMFMGSFEVQRNNLRSAISSSEVLLKHELGSVGFPGGEEEICTEGRCLKKCEVTDVNVDEYPSFLEEDCYCAENGGQICPKQLEEDGCPNICDKNYGCTLDVCPYIPWIFLLG